MSTPEEPKKVGAEKSQTTEPLEEFIDDDAAHSRDKSEQGGPPLPSIPPTTEPERGTR